MRVLMLLFFGGPMLIAATSCASGIVGYVGGTARFAAAGYPGFEFGNLDRRVRVYSRSSGCRVTGIEILTHIPNNLAILAMGAAFGPMPGTYHGPYPTREEATEALRSSSVAIPPHLADAVGSPGVGASCADLAAMVPLDDSPPGRCATFGEETLVLGDDDSISLIDRSTGKRYARYRARWNAARPW